MASKHKVIGNKNLSQRVPNVNTFESKSSTSLFDMGTFKLTTNLVPSSITNYKSKIITKNNFVNLEDLRIKSLDDAQIINNYTSKVLLNLDKTNLNSYACFGSLAERLRVSISSIIEKWPGSLFIDASLIDATTLYPTIDTYSYDNVNKIATFRINNNFIANNFNINYNKAVLTNDIKNIVTNYSDYVVNYKGINYKLLSFSGIKSSSPTMITITVEGDIFSDRPNTPNFSGNTWTLARTFHIQPNKETYSLFYNSLNQLETYLLTSNSNPKFTSVFKYPAEDEDGTVEFNELSATWPTTDGYNIDIKGSRFDNYCSSLISIGSVYDNFKTNLIIRQLVPNSYITLDQTDNEKAKKLLAIYGRQFDEIKSFIDGLAYINTVSYDKVDNAPDNFIYGLAKTLGWTVFPLFDENDLLNSIFTAGAINKDGLEVTPHEVNIELWRRIIINTGWLLQSKGTRQSIEAILSMIGAPESLIDFNEHIYLSNEKINLSSKQLNISVASSSSPYPKNTDGIIFQSTYENEFIETIKSNGFKLNRIIDNKKSWTKADNIKRVNSRLDTNYLQASQETVVNTKEIGISFAIAKAINYSAYQVALNYNQFHGLTFLEFVKLAYERHVSATSRKTVLNKYPTLLALLAKFNSNYPGSIYNVKKIISIIKKIDATWSRLFFQMLPATAILKEYGIILSNTVFTPQKFNYKRGIDAGSIFTTKQDKSITDTIFVYELDGFIEEEILAEITPISIEGTISTYVPNQNVTAVSNENTKTIKVLHQNVNIHSHSNGNYTKYQPLSATIEKAYKYDFLSENQTTKVPVYNLYSHSSKNIKITFDNNTIFQEVMSNANSKYGIELFKVSKIVDKYALTSVLKTYLPKLEELNNVIETSIDNKYLDTNNEYLISLFYEIEDRKETSKIVRENPLNYSDYFSTKIYPQLYKISDNYFDRDYGKISNDIKMYKQITNDTSLSNVYNKKYDWLFVTTQPPSKPIFDVKFTDVKSVKNYVQNHSVIKGDSIKINLDYFPIGPVTIKLNNEELQQELNFSVLNELNNSVKPLTYNISNVTKGDSIKISYDTLFKNSKIISENFSIPSNGTKSLLITIDGINYLKFNLSSQPDINTIVGNVNGIKLNDIKQLDDNINNIYLEENVNITPNSIINFKYIQQETSINEAIMISDRSNFTLNWYINEPLSQLTKGEFLIEFCDAAEHELPNWNETIHTIHYPYKYNYTRFGLIIDFDTIPELSNNNAYYFRIKSSQHLQLLDGRSSEDLVSFSETYKVIIPISLSERN